MWQPHACHMCLLSHAGTCKQPPSCHRGHEHSPHVTNGRPRSSREQEEAVRQSQEGQLASGLGLVGLLLRVSHWIRQHTALFVACRSFQSQGKVQCYSLVRRFFQLQRGVLIYLHALRNILVISSQFTSKDLKISRKNWGQWCRTSSRTLSTATYQVLNVG